jgi:hypothetical protein
MARSHESSDPGRRMSPDVNPVGQLPGIAALLCALSQPGHFLSFPLSERRIQRSQPNLQRSVQAMPGTATSTSDASPASGQPPSADTPVKDTGAGTDGSGGSGMGGSGTGSGDALGDKGAPSKNSGTGAGDTGKGDDGDGRQGVTKSPFSSRRNCLSTWSIVSRARSGSLRPTHSSFEVSGSRTPQESSLISPNHHQIHRKSSLLLLPSSADLLSSSEFTSDCVARKYFWASPHHTQYPTISQCRRSVPFEILRP